MLLCVKVFGACMAGAAMGKQHAGLGVYIARPVEIFFLNGSMRANKTI